MAKISLKQLARLSNHAGTALRAGVDARRVFATEAGRASGALQTNLQTVSRTIDGGGTLGEAFTACGDYFPSLFLNMVTVGEMTGRVEDVFLQLSTHYENLEKLRTNFWRQISWPLFQLTLSVFIISGVIWLQGILLGGMDIVGLGLVGTRGAIVFMSLCGGVAAGLYLLGNGLLRGWFGPGPMYWAMRIPKLGGCLRDMALARFSWALAVGLDAGLDARGAMRLALEGANNAYFLVHAGSIDSSLERGHEFHESLRQSNAFPQEFLDGLSVAELSGTHSESMHTLAREYEIRARQAADLLVSVAGYTVWISIVLFMIYFIYRFAMVYLGALNEAMQGLY